MRVSKNVYRSILIASFLMVNGLVIYGIAAAWKFLNTGADRSTMLHIAVKQEAAYMPKMNWDLTGQEGRPMEQQTLRELEADYRSAWYVKSIALANNDAFGLDDYYTEDARAQLTNLLEINAKQGTTTKGTTLEHNPKLEFYSLDGKLVVITDSNVASYEEIYQENQLIHKQESTDTYRIILLLEDGFWRIRQQVKLHAGADLKEQPFADVKPGTLKGINYYPREQPWEMFGEQFDKSTILTDFEIVREMGFNTVRIFVPYETFGGANLHEQELKQLHIVLDVASQENLKVLVTLFDFYGNYDIMDWTLTQRHAEKLVLSLRNHPALLAWDIKNEPDLDFENRGKDNVLSWLTNMSKNIRKWDPEHPITVGWSSPEAAVHLQESIDFVSFHYYGDPSHFQERYQMLRESTGGKPLVLEEFGKTSYSGIWNGFMGSSNKQAEYLSEMGNHIQDEHLSYFIWTLYDFEKIPGKVVGSKPWRKANQRHYGLLDKNGNPKPAANEIEKE